MRKVFYYIFLIAVATSLIVETVLLLAYQFSIITFATEDLRFLSLVLPYCIALVLAGVMSGVALGVVIQSWEVKEKVK